MSNVIVQRSSLFLFLVRLKFYIPYFLVMGFDEVVSIIRSPVGKPHSFSSNHAENPVFVLGPGRSGNTVFKRELARDYKIYFPPELPNLGVTIRAFSKSRRNCWSVVVDETIEAFKKAADLTVKVKGQEDYNLLAELRIDWEALSKKLKHCEENNQCLSYIINAIIYESYKSISPSAEAEEEFRWGDKTPWNLFHLPNIVRAFPNAHYVFMIRNPVSVVASYMKAFRESKGWSVKDATWRWLSSAKMIGRSKKLVSYRQLVRYEDFIQDPTVYLEEVSKIAGLSTREEANKVSSIESDKKLLHHENLSKPIFINEGSQAEVLTHSEMEYVVDCTKKARIEFSYD